jgi:hypothetical protein
MSLTVSEGEGGSFEMAPEGTFVARCYRIIDLGDQTTEFQGETKTQHKILFSWELLGDERMSDGRPFMVSKRYTASLHEKSALRKDLAAWRGHDFTPEELKQFDLEKVLGAYCLLGTIHTEKAGRDYCNVSSIMGLPKGMPKPDGVNEKQIFTLEKIDQAVFDSLSERLQEQIAATPQYRAAISKAKPAAKSHAKHELAKDPIESDFDSVEF